MNNVAENVKMLIEVYKPGRYSMEEFKEAVKKSIPKRLQMLDIITSHRMSKPNVTLRKNYPYDFLVSLSHDSNVVVAVVIAEKIKIK